VKTLKKFKMKMEDRKSLVGCLYKASRVDQKSPSCGDEFEFQREVDMGKLFQAAIYKGKKLTEMWAKAQEDADGIEKLKKLFQIKLGPDGKLLPQLPTFNYFKVLEPKPAEEVKEMLGGYHPDDDKPQSNAFAKGGAKSEDVPF
jgi:hypothetical protein